MRTRLRARGVDAAARERPPDIPTTVDPGRKKKHDGRRVPPLAGYLEKRLLCVYGMQPSLLNWAGEESFVLPIGVA